MCSTCKYAYRMSKMIQIRNVPEAVHRTLKSRAAIEGLSLSDYLLRMIQESTARPTPQELLERLRTRPPVRGTESAAEAVRRERDNR